jgi:hypothetical protein
MVYSQTERGFIVERYFASKWLAPLREAFSSAYRNKEVPNEATLHRMVTKFQTWVMFVYDKCLWSDRAEK